MAGIPLYDLPSATNVVNGDKFLIQQGVYSKQIDKEVLLTANNTSWKAGKSVGYSLDDLQGFTDELLSQAGITPSGLPDTLGASDRVEAIKALASSRFKNITEMISSTNPSEGNIVSSGLTLWKVTSEVTPLQFTGTSLYVDVLGEVFYDDFINPTAPDDRAALQSAIDFIEARGRRVYLKAGKPLIYIDTMYDGLLPTIMAGKSQGIVIKRPDLVWVDFGSAKIINRVPNLDDLVAIGSDTPLGSSADYVFSNIFIDGGTFVDILEEPQYIVRADYNVSRYCQFNRVVTRRSSMSNIKVCGFVIDFNNCDMRFAQQYANYEIVGASVDGVGGGARTALKFNHCVSDYAKLFGYSVVGSLGTTYCTWLNSTSDHVGRDRSGNTITDGSANSASFRGIGLFSADFLNCGSEFSTRAFWLETAKGVGITRCYTNNNGATDGSITNSQIRVEGYTEQLEIKGFRSSNLRNTTYDLSVTNPVAFNRNTIHIDDSIPDSRINFSGGTKSTAGAQVLRLSDFYKSGLRNPNGGSVVVGKPLKGNQDIDFFDQYSYTHDFDFLISTPAGGEPKIYDVLELTDVNRQGALYVVLDIIVGKSLAQVPTLPQRLQGKAAVNTGTFLPTEETQLLPVDGSTLVYSGIVYYWSGNTLRIKITGAFVAGSVRVSVVCRPETGVMTYEPLGVVF